MGSSSLQLRTALLGFKFTNYFLSPGLQSNFEEVLQEEQRYLEEITDAPKRCQMILQKIQAKGGATPKELNRRSSRT